jgi:hypothetical protein
VSCGVVLCGFVDAGGVKGEKGEDLNGDSPEVIENEVASGGVEGKIGVGMETVFGDGICSGEMSGATRRGI